MYAKDETLWQGFGKFFVAKKDFFGKLSHTFSFFASFGKYF